MPRLGGRWLDLAGAGGRKKKEGELGSGVQLGAGGRGPRHLSSILDGPAADVC